MPKFTINQLIMMLISPEILKPVNALLAGHLSCSRNGMKYFYQASAGKEFWEKYGYENMSISQGVC
jgi:hypothetical protein